MDVRILGPLEVLTHGAPAQLAAPRQRALLALMAINANEVVAKDRLVDELWGESPPASAGHAVEVYVSRLRKVLGHALRTQAPGYVLAFDADELDSRGFERLLEEGRRANAEASAVSAAALLREALALWRGAALADFAYERDSADCNFLRTRRIRQQAGLSSHLRLHRADVADGYERLG